MYTADNTSARSLLDPNGKAGTQVRLRQSPNGPYNGGIALHNGNT